MDDPLQLGGGVELHVAGEAEAVAERGREQSRPGGGADEGEGRKFERDGRGAGALSDDDVDPEVLHRHVEHLLGGPRHPVDLVEEEDFALLERGEDGGEVSRVLDGGARGDPDRGAHLRRDDHGEGGLAEAGGAGEQDVVGGGAPRAGGLQDEVELFPHLLLADEFVQVLRAQGGLDRGVLAVGTGVDQAVVQALVGEVAGVGPGLVPVHLVSPASGVSVPFGAVSGRPAGRVGPGGQRARLSVCRAARSSWGTGAWPPPAIAASACGVTAVTASSASRVA